MALLACLIGAPACFEDPASSGDTESSSSTGDATSGGQSTAPVSSGTSTTGETASSATETGSAETTFAETGPADTGIADTGSTDTGEAETSTDDTGTGPIGLCPSWSDSFDGAVDPVWEDVWGESITQAGGRTVIALTAAAGDQYPRRVIPWPALGVPPQAAVRFRMTPATLPTQFGTQLNTILEGPPGSDVTLSLNNTGMLEVRLTTRDDGMEGVLFEGPIDFPPGGGVEFVVADGVAQATIVDEAGLVVELFPSAEVPFEFGESRIGFAATNWGELGADTELAVEQFDLECE